MIRTFPLSGLTSRVPRAAKPRPPAANAAHNWRAQETPQFFPQSKIRNQQSSIVNPLSSHGQIALVQFNSTGDPENGGRFTVKKYHSAKTVSENAWQHDHIELLPLNQAYDPIPVLPHEGPEMVVVGEWVASID